LNWSSYKAGSTSPAAIAAAAAQDGHCGLLRHAFQEPSERAITSFCKSSGSELHALAERHATKRELGICFAAHADQYGGTVVDAMNSHDKVAVGHLGTEQPIHVSVAELVFDPAIFEL